MQPSPFNDFPKHGSQYALGPSGGPSVGETSRRLVQTDTFWSSANTTGAGTVPFDNTIPQSTEGSQFLSMVYRPLRAENLLRITVAFNFSNDLSGGSQITNLFVNSEANARATVVQPGLVSTAIYGVRLSYDMVAGTTSPITFALRSGGNVAGTTTMNGNAGANFGGVLRSHITVEEYETFSA